MQPYHISIMRVIDFTNKRCIKNTKIALVLFSPKVVKL